MKKSVGLLAVLGGLSYTAATIEPSIPVEFVNKNIEVASVATEINTNALTIDSDHGINETKALANYSDAEKALFNQPENSGLKSAVISAYSYSVAD